MNVRMDDLRESLMARPAGTPAEAPAAVGDAAGAGPGDAPPVDPMRWWGSLTEQFTSLATQALRDGAAFAGQHPAAPAANEGSDRTDPPEAGDAPPDAAAKARAGRTAPRKAARRRGQDER
jgi:hypothetical protein